MFGLDLKKLLGQLLSWVETDEGESALDRIIKIVGGALFRSGLKL